MNPSVPQLNLNWGFTPQQEQDLSVSKGMEGVTDYIDDAVKRKIDQDRQHEESLTNILKSTTGRYQKELLDKINLSRDEIKSLGKVNWNNAELRIKRGEILQDLTSLSQKANYVANLKPAIDKAITDNKYIIKDEANKAVSEEISKSLSEVDINKLEDIASGRLYVNHQAKMMDAVDTYLGKNINESLPFTMRNNGMLTTGQFSFRNNYRSVKNADGTYVIDKNTGLPKIEAILDNNQVDEILQTTGDYQGTYDYFKNMYDTSNIPNKVKPDQGDSYKIAVLEMAKNYINNITHQVDFKHLGSTREYIPKTSSSTNAAESEKNTRNEDVQAIYSYLKLGETPSIQNRIEQAYKGATNFIFAKWKKDNYFIEKGTDRVLTFDQMKKSGKLMANAKGMETKPEFKGKYQLFTGVAFTIPRGVGGSKEPQYYAFNGGFENDTNIENLAKSIHNGTWKKGNVAFSPTSQDNTQVDASTEDKSVFGNNKASDENWNNLYTPVFEEYRDKEEWNSVYNNLPKGAQYIYLGKQFTKN